MRKHLLLATILLAPLVWAQTNGAGNKTQTADQNNSQQDFAAQVQDYKGAFAKSAPGRCEKSHAWFTRIGEYPDETQPRVNAQVPDGDSYSSALAAQVNAYQSIWAAMKEPETQSAGARGEFPGSMASNTGAQSAQDDFYSQTVNAQFLKNRLAEAVNRL